MPQIELDDRDARILDLLQSEGRLTNVELADKVALSPSPCLRRVKRLEREGVVRRYRAVLDRKAVGLGMTVLIEIRVDKHSFENASELEAALAAIPEIVSCHMVSGRADFIAEVVVPDLEAYERLLTGTLLRLPMIRDIHSHFAIRSIKTDGTLSLSHL